VFPTWSVEIPAGFAETFVRPDRYWHAFGDDRSVSLTSLVVRDDDGPIEADRILREIPPLEGEAIADCPPRLYGRAALASADQRARASRLLSGMLAIEGRLLLATITSDDVAWARRVWMSIRAHEDGAHVDEPIRARPH
jgi:hypothetical protein